jgi:hypothetical protein
MVGLGFCLASSVVEVRLNQGVLRVNEVLIGRSEEVLVSGLACRHSTRNKENSLFESENAGIFSLDMLPLATIELLFTNYLLTGH